MMTEIELAINQVMQEFKATQNERRPSKILDETVANLLNKKTIEDFQIPPREYSDEA